MPIPKGTKFSKQHRENMSKARRSSAKVAAHHLRMRTIMAGRHPRHATASNLAVKALHRLGLTRETAPDLYKGYYEHFFSQFEDKTPAELVPA